MAEAEYDLEEQGEYEFQERDRGDEYEGEYEAEARFGGRNKKHTEGFLPCLQKMKELIAEMEQVVVEMEHMKNKKSAPNKKYFNHNATRAAMIGRATRASKITKVEKRCKTCKCVFYPKVTDVQRGWGKFCSKSCKAIEQTRRTGGCQI